MIESERGEVQTIVTDATWQTLSATFDLFHLMDAVETVNHFTVLSMLYNSFGVQPDEGSVDRLPTDVPYRSTVPDRAETIVDTCHPPTIPLTTPLPCASEGSW